MVGQGYTVIYKYIQVKKKTFDVFVMISCVLDWSMPVGDIQAEKNGISVIYILLRISFVKKSRKRLFNLHDVLMLLHVSSVDMYTNHFEYPFREQMLHPASNIQYNLLLKQNSETYRRTHNTPKSSFLTINNCLIGFFYDL